MADRARPKATIRTAICSRCSRLAPRRSTRRPTPRRPWSASTYISARWPRPRSWACSSASNRGRPSGPRRITSNSVPFGGFQSGAVMSVAEVQTQRPQSQYIDFWNEILVPKFVRWKHIVVDGLTLHSAAVFPTLNIKPGDKAIDAGCGFGDTAIELARRVAPGGTVIGIDCCHAFLAYGRKDAKAVGVTNVSFLCEDVQTYPFEQ